MLNKARGKSEVLETQVDYYQENLYDTALINQDLKIYTSKGLYEPSLNSNLVPPYASRSRSPKNVRFQDPKRSKGSLVLGKEG